MTIVEMTAILGFYLGQKSILIDFDQWIDDILLKSKHQIYVPEKCMEYFSQNSEKLKKKRSGNKEFYRFCFYFLYQKE